MLQEATQIIFSNVRCLGAGIVIGWVLGFITLLTIYIIWKVFPNLDGYVNIVRSYAKFLRKDKAKEKQERMEVKRDGNIK